MPRLLLFLLILLLAQTSARAQNLSAEAVRQAIDGGVAYLKATQNSAGGWHEEEPHVGGIPALCTLALLNAGVPTNDPNMVKALDYLRKIDPTTRNVQSNYVACLQTMVFCAADPEKDKAIIRRNVRWLVSTQKTRGDNAGGWAYPDGSGDPSNSQFAVLALHEAERAGFGAEIPPGTWEGATRYWRKMQNMDGSWSYLSIPPTLEFQAQGTGSMTCAGIVSLLIASEKSQPADAEIRGATLIPCQRKETDDSKRINHGKRWMNNNYSVARNPGNTQWHLYYLYGMERFGRMTSQRHIGDHDWFREGALQLLRSQKIVPKGQNVVTYWKSEISSEQFEQIATPLALLFLSKGRLPLLISKVQFTENDQNIDWDRHRHDMTNLVSATESRWKRNMTTQTVKLSAATVDDLLQSPVLYLGGVNSPLPEDAVSQRQYAQKLRDYIDRGGFILAEAVAPGGTFDAGFEKLLKMMFPEDEISPYLMPPEHPIWRAEATISKEYIRPIYCVDYACRTSIVHIPMKNNPRPSLSCAWELAGELKRNRAKYAAEAVAEIEAGLDLGVNILAYATRRELKTKEEMFASTDEERAATGPVNRGKLAVANLRHGGGCETAPNALRNLLTKSAEAMNVRTGIMEKTIAITSPELFDYPVVFMQGRHAFRLTPEERKQLAVYLSRGGILFANSICTSAAFDESFRREMAQILPETALTAISLNDPLLTSRFGGSDLSSITIRQTPKPPQKSPPKLEGIRIADRYAVIYSSLDISCALEKHSGECHGYTPEDAAKIGMNVLLYAMQQ